MINMIRQKFIQHFQDEPVVMRSPGRINLIGEHTDYNDGFVLPAAIDKYVEVACSKHTAGVIKLFSVQFGEEVLVEPGHIRPIPGYWTNYVLGVADQLMKRGLITGGFKMMIDGDIPVGAGLSSSAALCCAVCGALDILFDLQLNKHEIIEIAYMAEHEFAGVKCGKMDQYASVYAKKDHALLIDCGSMKSRDVTMDFKGYQLVLLNSNVKHNLASSAYNQRRQECETGVQQVQRHVPNVRSLRDITRSMLVEYVHDPLIHQRCRFVIEENDRVKEAVKCMEMRNVRGFGQLMYRSHEGLKNDFDVSCPELDWLVTSVRPRHYVSGARMMGGGFGGCTINLVKEKFVSKLIDEVSDSYEKSIGIMLTAYTVRTADGLQVDASAFQGT
jgi:galactokinase